jgi:hypothetical protein
MSNLGKKTKDRAGRPCLAIIRMGDSADDHRQGNEPELVVRVCPEVVVRFIEGAEYSRGRGPGIPDRKATSAALHT